MGRPEHGKGGDQPPAHERLGDQIFAATGYGVCATGCVVSALVPITDDLGPGQITVLFVVLTVLSLVGVRWRAQRRGTACNPVHRVTPGD